jgi:hypothetical protein
LRRGEHGNRHLQQAWKMHGEESFEFSVLEYVDASDLLRLEQVWIDRSGCTDRRIGFNICDVAGSPGSIHAYEWQGFVDPDSNEVAITNLFAFCREHGLDPSAMMRLASGKTKLKSHKGWTHRNSPRRREYVKTYSGFIDPDGRPAGPVTNLASFCRERGLDKTHMVAVAHGRIYSHRGWTYDNDRRNLGLPKPHTGFINPEGQRVIITNVRKFCQEHGLHPAHMHEVKSGRRKSHKGCTWRQIDE